MAVRQKGASPRAIQGDQAKRGKNWFGIITFHLLAYF
jgi:hypothetical protein